MRGDQISRQWRLVRALAGQTEGLPAQTLSDELGVSVRTVYRDLEVLERVGIPLVQDREGRQVRWRLMDPRGVRLGPLWTAEELAALYCARASVADNGPVHWLAALERAVEKAERALPKSLVDEARRRVEHECHAE